MRNSYTLQHNGHTYAVDRFDVESEGDGLFYVNGNLFRAQAWSEASGIVIAHETSLEDPIPHAELVVKDVVR